jgi:hypothetical protein
VRAGRPQSTGRWSLNISLVISNGRCSNESGVLWGRGSTGGNLEEPNGPILPSPRENRPRGKPLMRRPGAFERSRHTSGTPLESSLLPKMHPFRKGADGVVAQKSRFAVRFETLPRERPPRLRPLRWLPYFLLMPQPPLLTSSRGGECANTEHLVIRLHLLYPVKQMYRIRVFDELVYDTDPNLTNVTYSSARTGRFGEWISADLSGCSRILRTRRI